MKNLTEIVNESAFSFEMQDNVVGVVLKDEVENYLTKTNKFLSPETKEVLKWMVASNRVLSSGELFTFINSKAPSDAAEKNIFKSVRAVVKDGRALEFPQFQTRIQLDSVLNGSVTLDEIVIDFKDPKTREKLAKKYEALCWKIARQFEGKSEMELDDLFISAQTGLTHAMNTYGTKNVGKNRKKSVDADAEPITSAMTATFAQYAAYMIRFNILEDIKNTSHTVRVPVSRQRREKQETGANTKNNVISMSTVVGTDKDGNKKHLEDKISDYERAGKSVDYEDEDIMWKEIYKALDAKFDEKTLDVFYSHFGIHGHKEMNGKELMAKYGFPNQSNINVICNKVFKYIKSTPRIWTMFNELYEVVAENRNLDDAENRDFEPIYLTNSDDSDMDEDWN